jgi:hypothetical protein
VVTKVASANTLAEVLKGYLLLKFHIAFQKYCFLSSKKVLLLFLSKSYFKRIEKNLLEFFLLYTQLYYQFHNKIVAIKLAF